MRYENKEALLGVLDQACREKIPEVRDMVMARYCYYDSLWSIYHAWERFYKFPYEGKKYINFYESDGDGEPFWTVYTCFTLVSYGNPPFCWDGGVIVFPPQGGGYFHLNVLGERWKLYISERDAYEIEHYGMPRPSIGQLSGSNPNPFGLMKR